MIIIFIEETFFIKDMVFKKDLSYKSLYFEGYETVPTLMFID